MKRIASTLLAGALALGTTLTGLTATQAAPLNIPRAASAASDNFVDVQHRRGFYRDRGNHYYNGHRGYRDRRPGYRRHNGYWFPPAAFALGAIIGGAIANQPAPRGPVYRAPARVSNAHVRWCENRWRSYRAYDNSYQPYNGPRRQCVSPYG